MKVQNLDDLNRLVQEYNPSVIILDWESFNYMLSRVSPYAHSRDEAGQFFWHGNVKVRTIVPPPDRLLDTSGPEPKLSIILGGGGHSRKKK